jgi:hypothetical protein
MRLVLGQEEKTIATTSKLKERDLGSETLATPWTSKFSTSMAVERL